jgi:bifunctional non-homologous end joining protein LigD
MNASGRVWKFDHSDGLQQLARHKKSKAAKKRVPKHPSRPALGYAPRAPMPTNVRPMLATLVDRPFDRAGWIFEIKWDG